MTDLQPGCYIDGHHGHYVQPQAIRFAASQGFPLDDGDKFIVSMYDKHCHEEIYPHEIVTEIADKAIEYLNDKHEIPGHCWGWNEGDFGCYPIEDEEDDPEIIDALNNHGQVWFTTQGAVVYDSTTDKLEPASDPNRYGAVSRVGYGATEPRPPNFGGPIS